MGLLCCEVLIKLLPEGYQAARVGVASYFAVDRVIFLVLLDYAESHFQPIQEVVCW